MQKIITFEEHLKQVKLTKNLTSELFEEMLPRVKTINDIRLLDEATQVFDSEIGGRVSIWAVPDSDYAVKLLNSLIPNHLLMVQEEIVSSCQSYEDTKLLYDLVACVRRDSVNQSPEAIMYKIQMDKVAKYFHLVERILAKHADLVQLGFGTQTQLDTYDNLRLKCIGEIATEIVLLNEVRFLNNVNDVITFCKTMDSLLPKGFRDLPMQKNAYVLTTSSKRIQEKVFELLRSRIEVDKNICENSDVATQRKLYALLPRDFFEDFSGKQEKILPESRPAKLPLPETLVEEEFHESIREIDKLITEYCKNPQRKEGEDVDDDTVLSSHDKVYDLIFDADRFFFGKEKETDELFVKTLTRYKKVLRDRIKKLSIEGLEDFYHHTTYNKVSSKVALARYDDKMKNQIVNLTKQKAIELRGKVLSESSTNRKIVKMLA